jgi:Nuclear transport factor 2 (NTF2) domain
LQNIHEKVMALGFEEALTEVLSVDSQYSANDGVIILVTGNLQSKVSTASLSGQGERLDGEGAHSAPQPALDFLVC